MPRKINGLEEIIHIYDGYIVDIWGVIYDGGASLFDGVLDCLREMKRARRTVWLLTNAPVRIDIIAEDLARVGLDDSLYDGITTSGEATHQAIAGTYVPECGARCFMISHHSDKATQSFLAQTGVESIQDIEHADFILVARTDTKEALEAYVPDLEKAVKKGIPFVCPNPDKQVHRGDELFYCPGMLAERYEEMGGRVDYYGKPHRPVYRSVLQQMKVQNILAIGDTMHTDIAGATGMGLDAALVTSGVHRNENMTEKFFAQYPYKPMFIMDKFIWRI